MYILFGNSSIHGTLAPFPFLIVENKITKNVARIGVFYAYNNGTLNTGAVATNYDTLTTALDNINQQELASVISEIRYREGEPISIKGIEYGIGERRQ